MPFWHGDYPWRPFELGRRVGALRRELASRLTALVGRLGLQGPADIELLLRPDPLADPDAEPFPAALLHEIHRLKREQALDDASARQLLAYVASVLDSTGAISSDRQILLESFTDAVGDPRLVVHSPFGGRVNGPWGLAVADVLKERTGIEVEVQSGDDGILLRLPGAEGPLPLDAVSGLSPQEARERLLRSLPDSAVFGAQFRMNAARALLLPGNRPGRRTPFWLQRLRAKDLLQAVRRFPEFPLLAETYRDCLEDVMDLPHLEEVLAGIGRGEIKLTQVESALPSPVAQGLMWSFTNVYLYEWDTPKAERQLQTLTVSRELLGDILRDVSLEELLRPEAMSEVQGRLSATDPRYRARTAEELAVLLQRLGDLDDSEVAARSERDPAPWLRSLEESGRVARVPFPAGSRWVPVELEGQYRRAFPSEDLPASTEEEDARRSVLERFLG
jgi:ATP-dependent Lhr-like helicase